MQEQHHNGVSYTVRFTLTNTYRSWTWKIHIWSYLFYRQGTITRTLYLADPAKLKRGKEHILHNTYKNSSSHFYNKNIFTTNLKCFTQRLNIFNSTIKQTCFLSTCIEVPKLCSDKCNNNFECAQKILPEDGSISPETCRRRGGNW